jgi:lambda family phage tail tape measure protein
MAGEVAIRFSVQNTEVVRQALQALGKDGEKALQQLNAGTGAPNRGLNALSSLLDSLKGQVVGLAVPIGPLGTALMALGPVGIAAAAGIGLLVTAFTAAAARADALADRAKQLRIDAQTAGLTIEAFQALEVAGRRVGADADQTSRFIDRLTLSVEELRRGSGSLFDALARIDAGLVREVAAARTTTEAIDILARAYARLNDAGQRNVLVSAIAGRGGVAFGGMLQGIADAGGVNRLEESLTASGHIIRSEILGNFERTRREIAEIRRETETIWNRLTDPAVMEAQRLAALTALATARAAEALARGVPRGFNDPADPLGGRAPPNAGISPEMMDAFRLFLRGQRGAQGGLQPGTEGIDLADAAAGLAATEQARRLAQRAATELGLMRQWTSVLGDALTLTERRTQRELELTVALVGVENRQQVYNRAMAEFDRQQRATIVSTRQRLGIATEEEMVQVRLDDLRAARARGLRIDADEWERAEQIIRREVRETNEALQVRASMTPALTRLSLDSANLAKTLDTELAGALRGTTQSFLDMAKGTKTVGQGLADMTQRILDAIAQALILKSIVGPIAGGITGFFAPQANPWGAFVTPAGVTPSATGNVFAAGAVTPFALGGVVRRPTIFPMATGMGLMGEAGPEAVMPLRRLGNGRLGVEAAGGGATMVVNIYNNTRAQVRTEEADDGRGGRRMDIVIEEMVTSAATRPGSRFTRTLAASQGMTRL